MSWCYLGGSILGFILLVVIYGKIWRDSYNQSRRIHELERHEEGTRRKGPSNKGLRVVTAILVTYFVLFAPYFAFCVVQLANYEGISRASMDILDRSANVVIIANSSVNVIIYAVLAGDFRRAYTIVLCPWKNKLGNTTITDIYT